MASSEHIGRAEWSNEWNRTFKCSAFSGCSLPGLASSARFTSPFKRPLLRCCDSFDPARFLARFLSWEWRCSSFIEGSISSCSWFVDIHSEANFCPVLYLSASVSCEEDACCVFEGNGGSWLAFEGDVGEDRCCDEVDRRIPLLPEESCRWSDVDGSDSGGCWPPQAIAKALVGDQLMRAVAV